MASRLIQLEDGTLVEAEVPENQAREIAGGLAEKVNKSLDTIQPVLTNISRSIVSSWQDLSKEMQIEGAEVELGLSFEGEGNLYITKAKAGANLTVKLKLKPLKGE